LRNAVADRGSGILSVRQIRKPGVPGSAGVPARIPTGLRTRSSRPSWRARDARRLSVQYGLTPYCTLRRCRWRRPTSAASSAPTPPPCWGWSR